MKDFYEFREDLNERMDRNSGADGHSDGQTDSNTDRKKQDKDFDNMMDHNDGDEAKVYRDLLDLYGYKEKIAMKTVMRNNPDIKKIDSRSGKVTYK